jgi:hypothetical protein
MALETATFINELNVTNPTPADAKSQGDDHLRLIKSTIKNTFPNILGAVVASHTALNYTVNVTSDIQMQFNNETTERKSEDLLRGLISGQSWSGTHDFTNTSLTVPAKNISDNSMSAASTSFVQALILNASLSNPTNRFAYILSLASL